MKALYYSLLSTVILIMLFLFITVFSECSKHDYCEISENKYRGHVVTLYERNKLFGNPLAVFGTRKAAEEYIKTEELCGIK